MRGEREKREGRGEREREEREGGERGRRKTFHPTYIRIFIIFIAYKYLERG